MILNSAPQNEAVMSNVGQIGEFRIRNSAKAFNILSSGLYANKIRAIIRELSCNAADSHVAAGKASVPFDVHMPTTLEPYFSIRDYGTGLNHDQVTNIYTTYFESTKTNSNEFIGALGLGSKSPFSYTDNFTVTAIQGGKKGIYTAFINDEGVPSIALMMEESTDEQSGVEIKFSVNSSLDFGRFRNEAASVYTYFKTIPNFTGADVTVTEASYDVKDIIPGVHSYKNANRSVAVMGNIAYPIEIPSGQTNPNFALLKCGIELHFDIGELDFQASREGLSYIPQTISAIEKKLDALNARLTDFVREEADKLDNVWQRAFFLMEKRGNELWFNAVIKYIADTKFELIDIRNAVVNRSYSVRTVPFKFFTEDLASKYNIRISAFSKATYETTCKNVAESTMQVSIPNGTQFEYKRGWEFGLHESTVFIVNDTNTGALERAKFHWRSAGDVKSITKAGSRRDEVYILSKFDSAKGMDTDSFFKALANPPRVLKASELMQKERAASNIRKVNILKLNRKDSGQKYYSRRDGAERVWRECDELKNFDKTKQYYYVALNGFVAVNLGNYTSAKELFAQIEHAGIKELKVDVYGVRKADLDLVKNLPNWIPLDKHIRSTLASIDTKTKFGLVKQSVDRCIASKYNLNIAANITDLNSPMLAYMTKFKDVDAIQCNSYSFDELNKAFGDGTTIAKLAGEVKAETTAINNRYPLISHVSYFKDTSDEIAFAEYINLIDNAKKGN